MSRKRFPTGPVVWVTLALSLMVLAPIAGAVPVANGPAAASGSDLHTEHYDLHVEGLDAAEVGSMLEQLHAQLRAYFGTAPGQRLSVAVYSTRERWASALQAEGQYVPPRAGGYYAPGTHKAYLWLQPTAYFTRQVLLHEVTHQFHWLTASGNKSPTATWYYEGLAEYFGMHNWDGKRLETGVIPAVTLEDYPSRAMRNFEAFGGDLQRMLAGGDRPESWALVHFLMDEYPSQFRKLAAKLDRQEDAAGAWKESLGSDWSQMAGQFQQWMWNHRQPWQIVWVSWQQRGDAIEGDCGTSGITLLKETPKALTVEIEPQTAGGAAGLVFAYQSKEDFYLLQVRPDEKFYVVRRQNGAWSPVSSGELPRGGGHSVLSVTQDDKSTVLRANSQSVSTISAVGQMGLNAEGCRALFRIKSLP